MVMLVVTDTVKFAQLLFGCDVQFENYSHRLPHNSDESFLLFAKGACKELIVDQLEEIKDYEIGRGNLQNPEKSQQMRGRSSKKVYYYSCQVSKEPCTCRSGFGADAHHTGIPTSSAHHTADATEEHLRFNCTLRWHDMHWKECPEYVALLLAMGVVSSPVVSGSDLPTPSSG